MDALRKYISPLLLLLAAAIWGFAFAAQGAADTIPPFTLGAARSILATLFLLIIIPIFDKTFHTGRTLFRKKTLLDFNRTEIIGGAICGFFLALASFFQQLGINSGTEAGKASFITALYVVIVPIYALFLKKRASLNVWGGIIISILGFYLLCIDGNLNIATADLFVLASAFTFPLQILAIDKFSPLCDGVRMSCVQFFTATIVNTAFALIFESPLEISLVFSHALPVLYLGIASSGIAYTLQIIGQRGFDNPAAASILLCLESVFGVIGASIFLKESLSAREYVGCAIVFVAVMISQVDFKALFKKK